MILRSSEVETALGDLLSKEECIRLLEVIHSTLSCTQEGDLLEVMKLLGSLVDYDFAISGLARMNCRGQIRSYDVINISYPAEWINLYIRQNYYLIDPVVRCNFSGFELQYWTDTYILDPPPKNFISIAEDFNLRKGYTHGVRNLSGCIGSIFSVAGRSIEHDRRTEAILECVTPHLHQALTRIITGRARKMDISLSHREREIINWIKQGKSTWDISRILCISENTIKFHIKNIFQKLDVTGRTQAVAVAMERGLIDTD